MGYVGSNPTRRTKTKADNAKLDAACGNVVSIPVAETPKQAVTEKNLRYREFLAKKSIGGFLSVKLAVE